MQLEVELVSGGQVLSDGAYAASADDDQHDKDVDQMRRSRRCLTRPHCHFDPAPDSFTQRFRGSVH